MTTVHTLPRRTPSAPLPITGSASDGAGRAHLSIPKGAELHAFAKDADVCVYQHAGTWRVQCCGVTAPIDVKAVDAYAAFVVEVSTRRFQPSSARRFLSLLPDAFIFGL